MSILHNVLESIFPVRKDFKRVACARLEDMQHRYLLQKNVHGVSLSSFQDLLVRACVHEMKYFENEQAATLLSCLLDTYIGTSQKIFTIIPIPLSRKRKRSRGYNQIELLLKHTPEQHSYSVNTEILHRVRDTKPQTRLKKDERLTNMQNAFSVTDGTEQLISGVHILLLDDVYTTGATIREAKAAISPHNPASITCVALAH